MHGTDITYAAKFKRGVHQHLDAHQAASPRSKQVQSNDGMKRARRTKHGKIEAAV